MAAMMVSARLLDRIDGRRLIVVGLILMAYAMWDQAHFTSDVSFWTIQWIGAIQGFGLGLVFVPTNTLTFATLPPEQRTEATGVFNLVRNIGSSIGVSIVISQLIRNTQINHEEIAGRIQPFGDSMRALSMPELWDFSNTQGLLALNEEITRQANTIAFNNDFKLLMLVALFNIPMVLLFRLPKKQGDD